jgi:5-methylcytosine-specific restriction endonuclease McrA
MNPRLTKKDKALIKGALRRAFARSELRNKVISATIMQGYSDPLRPRVKTWCKCPGCNEPTPKSYMIVDHKSPVVPLHISYEDLSISALVDAIWCEESNLQALCDEPCHLAKSKAENKQRRAFKKTKHAGSSFESFLIEENITLKEKKKDE